jgi:predicted MFS family arabinose efflux permease
VNPIPEMKHCVSGGQSLVKVAATRSKPDVAPLDARSILLFAITAGVMMANLYYVQPLLATVAAALGRDTTTAGYLVTFTQAGYAIGVFLIVPVGDVLDRRKMLSFMMIINAVALTVAALSRNFAMFAAASLLIGITSSAVMVVISYVAVRAPDSERGRRVGQVMTGLILGILLARTVSGLIGHFFGWRSMYVIAVGVVIALLFALRAVMVREQTRGHLDYPQLLLSIVDLVKSEPQLRLRSFYSMLGLGTFSVLWTGLTFLLSGAPYHYSEATIGLFGLAGAAGAVSANLAGRLGDRGHAHRMTAVLAIILLLSWGMLALGQRSVGWIIVGAFLLDVGMQGLQVTHQTVIFKIAPHARSRVTAVFTTSAFFGASMGSAIATKSFALGGWIGLSIAGAALPAILLGVWGINQLRRNSRGQ